MKLPGFPITLCLLGLMAAFHGPQAAEPEAPAADQIEPAPTAGEEIRGVRLIEPVDLPAEEAPEAIAQITPISPARRLQTVSPEAQAVPRAFYQKIGLRRSVSTPQAPRPSRLDPPAIVGRRRPAPEAPPATAPPAEERGEEAESE